MGNLFKSGKFLKLLYAFLFILVLPVLLILWAAGSGKYINLLIPVSGLAGICISVFGLLIMISGMLNIIIYGKGLPMNAFPPSQYVNRGIYKIIAHPIYTGFSFLCIGLAVVFQSSSGFWLVSPIVTLGCVALVEGYEKNDMRERFGNFLPQQLLHLPLNIERKPLFTERLSFYILVLIPAMLFYILVTFRQLFSESINISDCFDINLSGYTLRKLIYHCSYLFVLLAPLSANKSSNLHKFSISGLIGTFLVTLVLFLIPSAVIFPSLFVVWVFLSAWLYSKSIPSLKILWLLIAILFTFASRTINISSGISITISLLIVFFALQINWIWEKLRIITERFANSWKEWHVGPVRIINHGIYVGAGAFLGLLIMGTLLDNSYVLPLIIVSLSTLIMAGLWAQFIESSSGLLRPFGYYGGVIGVVLGSFIVYLLGYDIWLVLGAFAVAGPLIQAAGRLRCLVQGCCHGSEASDVIGIRYIHPRSRVCKLAKLTGIPVHPTPLYSIIWNVFTGIIIARLCSLNAAPPILAGLYLIMNGLGRFIEESYRGEPQTPVIGKLRLYQLLAIASVISGAILTTINTNSVMPDINYNWSSVFMALGVGLITWFLMGVDFPNSNKRFSRLV